MVLDDRLKKDESKSKLDIYPNVGASLKGVLFRATRLIVYESVEE